ncbi:hypothetical protein JSCD8_34980 [Clostridioides difficile]|nr:hypothetical protein JSCD8_34980 [Clostridioides difficile]
MWVCSKTAEHNRFERLVCESQDREVKTLCVIFFFFQAEDGIRDLGMSRGLGEVYKRRAYGFP